MPTMREVTQTIELKTPVAHVILSSLKHLREGYQLDPEVDYPKLDTMIHILERQLKITDV